MATRWVCPHCDHAATIRETDRDVLVVSPSVIGVEGQTRANLKFTVCPNPDCKKTTVELGLQVMQWYKMSWGWRYLNKQRLMPPTYARPLPNYVPLPIVSDYTEACAIADLSPKAAATLARRALQGMVRDFFGVSERNLYLELEAIKNDVDPLTWQAIDAVRKIGNIGAHMEKDINVMVEVDSDEALRLIRLIEVLVKDWYVANHEREVSLAELVAISDSKQDDRKAINQKPEPTDSEAQDSRSAT